MNVWLFLTVLVVCDFPALAWCWRFPPRAALSWSFGRKSAKSLSKMRGDLLDTAQVQKYRDIIATSIGHIAEPPMSGTMTGPCFVYKDSNDLTHVIINRPEVTMNHSFVEPDPSYPMIERLGGKTFVKYWADEIAADYDLPDSRLKALYATLAGQGKGKTRFLMELMKELSSRENIFPLAITFNNHMSKIGMTFGQGEFNYAFEIVTRMLSMAFKVDYSAVRKSIESALKHDECNDNDSAKFIRGCVQFLVEAFIKVHSPSDRSKPLMFVLMVDESMKIARQFPNSLDIHHTLREALLTDEIPNVICNLVMTTLDVPPLGISTSGRTIKVISLPTMLKTSEIMMKWLQESVPATRNMTTLDEAILMKLVYAVAPLPRSVESLQMALNRIYGNKTVVFNRDKSLNNLISMVMSNFEIRYHSSAMLVDPETVRASLWNDEVVWSNAASELTSLSMVINAPDSFPPSHVPPAFIPQMCALSWYRLRNHTTRSPYLQPMVYAVSKIIENDPNSEEGRKEGSYLELITSSLLDGRIQSFQASPRLDRPTLSKLLCISNTKLRFKILGQKLNFGEYWESPNSVIRNSYHNIDSHVKNLFSIQAPKDTGGVTKVTLHDDEYADYCAYIGGDARNPGFALFVDCKSRELLKNGSSRVDDRMNFNLKQALRLTTKVARKCEEYLASHNGGANPLSLGGAIAAGNFAFVYLSTADFESKESKLDGRIIILGKRETDSFLMPLGLSLYEMEKINQQKN